MNDWRIDCLAERHARREGNPRCSPRNAGDDGRRREVRPCGHQRSLAAPRNPPDGKDRDLRERPRCLAGTRLRRRARGHARGLDRLQSVRSRAHLAASGEDAGTDSDQPVPTASLVGRDPTRRHGCLPAAYWKPRTGQFPQWPTRSRSATWRGSRSVSIASARLHLLFDPEHALDERIAMEQFAT